MKWPLLLYSVLLISVSCRSSRNVSEHTDSRSQQISVKSGYIDIFPLFPQIEDSLPSEFKLPIVPNPVANPHPVSARQSVSQPIGYRVQYHEQAVTKSHETGSHTTRVANKSYCNRFIVLILIACFSIFIGLVVRFSLRR